MIWGNNNFYAWDIKKKKTNSFNEICFDYIPTLTAN